MALDCWRFIIICLLLKRRRAERLFKGFGIALDAPRILRLAARIGVHLSLHGHKHRALSLALQIFTNFLR